MKLCILAVVACSISSQLLAAPAAKAKFQAGAATSTITPPLGLSVIGGFVPFPSKHVHDELLARCLVLDDGKTRLALVVCDILGIHRIVSDETRRLIQAAVGIPPENVLICATHTHSASSALGQDRLKHEQTLDDYQRFVAGRIADGVQCAANNLRPARMAFATAQAPEHVFNRRWFLKEGTMPPNPFGRLDKVKMNPGGGSPNLVEPAGPTDPGVSIIALRDASGKFIAVFSSYSLHYVGGVGPAHISADYYGVYCRRLEQLLQPERQDPPAVAMMSNGTSGDINNINFRQPRPRKEAYEQIRAVAEDVADKVFQALAKVEYRDDVTLGARFRDLNIAYRRLTPQELEWAKKTVAAGPPPAGKTDLSFIYAERALRMAEYPPTLPVAVQVLRIGDVCMGTMPNEVFCEIGLEFKKVCPRQPAFLVSLAHGYLGYLPTPRHFELGGYETWLGTNRLERQASVKMFAALVEMAAEVSQEGNHR